MTQHIYEDEAGFYYEDEEGDWIGPFSNYEQAQQAYDAYKVWECKYHAHYANPKFRDEGV